MSLIKDYRLQVFFQHVTIKLFFKKTQPFENHHFLSLTLKCG